MSLGKEIYRHHDEYGPLVVWDDGNKRYLGFGEDDEQSCQLKSDPFLLQHDYTRAMLLVLLFIKPDKVTLLGLGGGTLVTTLHQYLPELVVTAVELRFHVIKIAQRFFQLPRTQRITVLTEDAGDFLRREQCDKPDVILADIYDGDGVDSQQTESWFVEGCYQQLSDNGWLVMNCWRQHRGEQSLIHTLSTLFADVRACATAEGNWVILAGKRKSTKNSAQLKTDAKQWSKVLGFSLLPALARLQQLS